MILDENCCGITYSESFKWTLRNGGLVNSYDGTNPQLEPVGLLGKSDGIFGGKSIIEGIWGVSSIRKDCYEGIKRSDLFK